MKHNEKLKLMFIVFFINYIIDRITKILAVKYLADGKEYSYIGNLIKITYAENTGAFLGAGSNLSSILKPLILIIIPIIVILWGIIYCIYKENNKLSIIYITSIVAGGIANIQDRIFNDGKVIDFLNFGIGETFRTGILNFADMSITFGAILFVFNELAKSKKEDVNKNLSN